MFKDLKKAPCSLGLKLNKPHWGLIELKNRLAVRLKIGQRSFAFRGAKSYNDLPDDIKKTRDTKHFKKNLYNYLLKL